MTKRFGSYITVALALAAAMTACNDDSNSYLSTEDPGYTSETMYSSTAITSFNLKANSKVLAHLDSIFFTIDLEKGRIFNADSLPYGTDISKLLPVIGTSGSSNIEIMVRNSAVMNDTTVTYSSSMTDSIDFSAGAVIVKVTSLNEQYTGNYAINVNVHKVKSDSLTWTPGVWATLPGNPDSQKTVERDNAVYTFMRSGSAFTLMTTPDPADFSTSTTVSAMPPADIDLRSITATDEAFYGLTTAGKLFTSTDGLAWTDTGESLYSIYGAYGDKLLGTKKSGDSFIFATIPDDGTSAQVPDDCPVSGTSALLLTEESDWSYTRQAYFTGGRTASGDLTGATWSYDGTSWAKISETPINMAMEGITLMPYFTFRTSTKNWRVTKEFTLIAMGGRLADGSTTKRVYVSKNMGITWSPADELLQLPANIQAFADADAVVWTSVLGSRAVTAVTSWDCPYIYLYGGTTSSGVLYPQVRRGVINRLSFKPLI